MKYPHWTDPNDSIAMIKATYAAIDGYLHGNGSVFIRLGPEHVEALNLGKVLTWNDGEHDTFVVFADAVRKLMDLGCVWGEIIELDEEMNHST